MALLNTRGSCTECILLSPVSLAMEAIGDITASAEVSRVEVDGPEFDSRIQGGVLVRYLAISIS